MSNDIQLTNDTLFGLAIQTGTGATQYALMSTGYDTPLEPSDGYYFATTDIAVAPIKNMESLPPEIQARALPGGMYPTGTWMEGVVSMIPRLDSRFGWFLLATMGECSTLAGVTAAQVIAGTGSTADVNTHIFRFDEDQAFFIPWFSAWRQLPHKTTTSRVLEKFQDCHVRSLTLAAMAGAPLNADVDVVGRLYQKSGGFTFSNPDPVLSATYDNFEAFGSTGCTGSVKIDDEAYNVQSASITITNAVMGANQSIVVGSLHPIDFPVLGRNIQVVVNFLMSDYDLYLKVFGGSAASLAAGVNMVCQDYDGDIDIDIASQELIGATAEYYRIRMRSGGSDNVSWFVRPLRATANRALVVQMTGLVQAVSSGDPFRIYLQNDTANYTVS